MLERLGRFCARRHRVVLIVWALVFVGLSVGATVRHGEEKDVFTIPNTQSQQALDLLDKSFPAASGTSATVVYQAKTGVLNDAANQAAINQTITNLKAIPDVSSVSSPFVPTPTGLTFDQGKPQVQTTPLNINQGGPGQDPAGTVGFSGVSFTIPITGGQAQAEGMYKQIVAATQPAVQAGLTVTYGGPLVDVGNPPNPGISKYSDYIGILVAIVILVIALGSVVSMSVPIGTAIVSVISSLMLVKILTANFTIGSVPPILGTMIGLGVGIDYSLFIVSRHKQNLAAGNDLESSIGRSMATSGSAVLFAGITVCIAMGGLFIIGIPYVTQLGLVAAMFVAMAMAAALTMVPAMLGALGPKINALEVHKHHENADIHATLSARWARMTSRKPVVFALLSLAILLLLAFPATRIQLGFTDDGDVSPELTQKQAYDALTRNFGVGQNGPLLLAVDLPDVNQGNGLEILQAFQKLNGAIAATPGVAQVSLPIPNNFPTQADPNAVPTAAIVQVVPSSAPNSDATTDLVHNLRDTVIPQALQGTAISPSQVFVGGQTATLIDLTAAIQARLFLFIGVVILGAFLLLMMVFRSVFVPFQAAIMNLLSIAATYGVVVAIFQWGWGKSIIGLSTTVPIVAFVPVMMFAVLFGLSMDYEVFLISRIKEEFNKSGDNRDSVVTGLASTARVITAAAMIMIAVFLSFVPSPDPTVKMIGLGMAVAVLVDATIVRMMLVPSTMELAGKANWWFPHWLDRILPHIHVE